MRRTLATLALSALAVAGIAGLASLFTPPPPPESYVSDAGEDLMTRVLAGAYVMIADPD